MRTLFFISILVFSGMSFAQSTTSFKYEGYLENSGAAVNANNQAFTVTIRIPGCASTLGLTTWSSGSTVNIVNGTFTINPTFPAAAFAAAMDPNKNSSFGCSPNSARVFDVAWSGETFTIALADAPRASYASSSTQSDNSLAIGGVSVMPAMTCASNQILKYITANSRFECQNLVATDIPNLSAAQIPNLVGDVTGTVTASSVQAIRGVGVSAAAPTNGQILKYNGTNWAPAADDAGVTTDASYSAKGVVQINTDQTTSGLYVNAGVLALPNMIGAAGTTTNDGHNIPVLSFDTKGRITNVASVPLDDPFKLPLSGGSLTGNINMGTRDILNATNLASTNVSTRNIVLNDNDTNNVTIRTPTDISANYVLTLPVDDGTSGQILSTDGNGTLSWTTAGGGGTVTSVTSSNALIGVATPTTTPVLTVNTASGGLAVDGGNSVSSAMTLGTNSNFALNFETNNSTRMTLSNTGNLGIGVIGASEKLEVAGNIWAYGPGTIYGEQFQGASAGGTATSPVYTQQGATTSGLFFPALNVLGFSNNGTETLRMSATNNVGIGTTTPGSKLDLNGALSLRGMAAPAVSPAAQGRVYFDSTSNKFKVSQNGGAYIDLIGTPPSGFNPNQAIVANASGTATSFSCALGQVLGFDVSGFATCTNVASTQWTTSGPNIYYATGNVGIGTSSPGNLLDMMGSSAGMLKANLKNSTSTGTAFMSIQNNLGNALFFGVSGTAFSGSGVYQPNYASIYSDSNLNGMNIGTEGSQPIGFFTNNTERMRITPAGNVGIGTTTPASPLTLQTSATNNASVASFQNQFSLSTTGGAAGPSYANSNTISITGSGNPSGGAGKFWTVFSGSNSANDLQGSDHYAANMTTFGLNSLVGVRATAETSGSGSASVLAGVLADAIVNVGGTSAVTGIKASASVYANAYSAAGLEVSVAGSGSMTSGDAYGIKIGSIGSTATNRYGLYQSDSTAKNFFAGRVSVGTPTISPSHAMTIAGDTRLYDSGGTNPVTIGVQSGSTSTFRFPASNGISGNALVTDGSGNTSWGDPDPGNSFTLQVQLVSGSELIAGIGATPFTGGSTNVGFSNIGRPTLEFYSLTSTGVVGVHTTAQIHPSWTSATDFIWTATGGSPTSSARYWIGYSSSPPTYGATSAAPNGSDTYSGLSLLGFRYSTAAGDPNFTCVACNSGACSTSPSGVALSASLKYKMRIEKSGTTAKMFINNALVCTLATNLPTSAAMVPSITSQTLDGTGKHIQFHRIRMRSAD